ncbi:MAG TPA: acyl-CoA desaturase [Gemmatimonadales bacterium]|nr:acyl-CoA desaturase [Gemmatimonadales bacterium]
MNRLQQLITKFRLWFDTSAMPVRLNPGVHHVDWVRVLPFVAMHLACLGVIWVGASWTAVGVAAGLYVLRMFAITGFYHRYFSHRTYEVSRPVQFLIAVAGATCVQRGPLWWAAHHRKHHRHADTEVDVHSPRIHGFWWSHMGWITSPENFPTDVKQVPDLARYPELRFLDRFDIVVPLLLAIALFVLGGAQWLVWGFFISTVVLFHCSCFINSLAHQLGRRRYPTPDDSKNSLLLSLITFGEGWHNNHHWYPGATRQGFYWWEVDFTFYGLWLLSRLGIIRNLHPVPARVRERS